MGRYTTWTCDRCGSTDIDEGTEQDPVDECNQCGAHDVSLNMDEEKARRDDARRRQAESARI